MVRKVRKGGLVEVPASFVEKRLGKGNVLATFEMIYDDVCHIYHSESKTMIDRDDTKGIIKYVVAPKNKVYTIPTEWSSLHTVIITFNEVEKRLELYVR